MEDSSWSWSCWINFWNLFLTIIMSLVQFFKLHQYIWPRGRLLCQNRCQQGTLYFRQSPDRAIHLSCQRQFLELKCFKWSGRSLVFRRESGAIQKLSHKFHLNLLLLHQNFQLWMKNGSHFFPQSVSTFQPLFFIGHN